MKDPFRVGPERSERLSAKDRRALLSLNPRLLRWAHPCGDAQ